MGSMFIDNVIAKLKRAPVIRLINRRTLVTPKY